MKGFEYVDLRKAESPVFTDGIVSKNPKRYVLMGDEDGRPTTYRLVNKPVRENYGDPKVGINVPMQQRSDGKTLAVRLNSDHPMHEKMISLDYERMVSEQESDLIHGRSLNGIIYANEHQQESSFEESRDYTDIPLQIN